MPQGCRPLNRQRFAEKICKLRMVNMKYMAMIFDKYKKSPFYICVIIFFSPGRAVTTVLTGKGSYPQSWDSHVDFWATQEAQHSHF